MTRKLCHGLVMLVLVASALVSGMTVYAQGGGELAFGTPVEATLAPGESHSYTFRSEGGETLTATMIAGNTTLDPVLELYGPSGALVAFNDDAAPGQLDAAINEAPLQDAGIYTLVARSYGERSGGPYTLLATRGTLTLSGGGGEITIGATVEGEIAEVGQSDRWTFTGAAGQVISIALTHPPGSNLDPLVELIGPEGTPLAASDDDGGNLNSLISGFALPASGTYTIVARSWGNATTGAYTLQLVEGMLEPSALPTTLPPDFPPGQPPQPGEVPPVGQEGTIAIGDTVEGTLAVGMMDVWTFTAGADVTVGITLDSLDGDLDPLLELVGPGGEVLARDDDGGEGLNSWIRAQTLPAAGTYVIRVRAFADASGGRYRLSLMESQPPQGHTGNIEPGQTINAELASGAEDRWTFVARAGDVVSIALYAEAEAFDTVLRITDAGGRELANDDDGGIGLNSMIRGWRVPVDGAYTIHVGSFRGNAGGPYLLILQTGDRFIIPDTWMQGSLPLGEPVEGTLTAGALTHVWTFKASAGEYLTLDYDFSVSVEVLDANGDSVNSFFEPGIPTRFDTGGEYYLIVRGFEPTTYTITLSQAEPPQINTGSIEIGQTIGAVLDVAAEDEWTFVARAGDVVSIAVYADTRDLDTVLRITDAGGRELAYDDDSVFGLNSMIRGWRVPADGAYTIRVGSFGGRSGGPYTLIVRAGDEFIVPDAWMQGPLPIGEPVEATFTEEAMFHVWTFEAGAGQYLTLDYPFNVVSVTVVDAGGDYVSYFDPGVPTRFEQAGLYYLIVNSFEPQTYTLTLSPAEPPQANAGSIEIGQTVTQTLSAGAEDEWTFSGRAGQTVSVAITGDFDTVLTLRDSTGSEIAYDDDSGSGLNSLIESVTLPADGSYTIVVGSFGGRSGGSYTLTLSEGGPEIPVPQANAGSIEIGQTVTQTLSAGAEDVWTFSAEVGQVLSVGVFGEDFDTVIRITGPGGDELAFNDDGGPRLNSLIHGWRVPANGEYAIRVGGFGEEDGGPYTLMLVSGNTFVAPEAWQQGTIVPGQPFEGRFDSPAASHIWAVEAPAGYFSLEADTSQEGFLWVEVFDTEGEQFTAVEVGFPFELTEGQYYIVVNGTEGQAYRLTFAPSEPPEANAGSIEIGQTIEQTLDAGAEDEWTFTGRAGQQISVTIQAEFDTVLTLRDADGNEVAFDDDSGEGLNSLLEGVILPNDGTYTIVVGSFAGRSGGAYTLTLIEGLPVVTNSI